jgi:hypothetical protein
MRHRQPQKRAGPWLTLLGMPGVNRQGQAHIVSTAIRLPRSCKAGREVEATPWVRTWFSIDPQPASISPTINISIVFICAFPVDCGQIICHPAIKNDSSAILRSFGLRCGALLWRIPRDVETRLRRKFKRCVYCRRRFKRGVYNDSATIEHLNRRGPFYWPRLQEKM